MPHTDRNHRHASRRPELDELVRPERHDPHAHLHISASLADCMRRAAFLDCLTEAELDRYLLILWAAAPEEGEALDV